MIFAMMRFHERLRKARKDAGFSSQEKFAELLGMKRTQYLLYETGEVTPDPDETIPRIAKGLGLPPYVLNAWQILDQHQDESLLAVVRELPEDLKQTVLFEYFAQKDPADIIAIFKRTHSPEKLKELVEAAQAELKRVK